MWRKYKTREYGNRIINSRIVQESVSTKLYVCPREFTARKLWKKVTKAITAYGEEFYLITQIRTGRNYIFTIAACCVWQTPRLLALFELGVLRKVWFRPQVGNFLLFETRPRWFAVGVALTKLSSPFTTVSGRVGENSHTFYPPGTSASGLRRCGGERKKKRASRRLERKRNAAATLGPLFFSSGDSGDRWEPEAGL